MDCTHDHAGKCNTTGAIRHHACGSDHGQVCHVQCNIHWQAQPTAVALWILHGAFVLGRLSGCSMYQEYNV